MAAAASILISAGIAYLAARPAPLQTAPAVMRDVAAAGTAARNLWGSAVYRTKVGERAAVTLADGSVVTLDTDSVIKVRYTSTERGVRLLRGQAIFQVAKHKPIPFQVYAGGRRITAVGTRFDVRLSDADHGELHVALLEGVVKIAPASPTGVDQATVTLAPGQVLEAAAGAPQRVVEADLDQWTSWRGGVLDFNDVSLENAVSEINRYTIKRIRIADPALARLRVSGVFNTDDPEHFAQTLAEAFPIKVAHDAEGAPVLEAQ
jgi:transmembrane sensor